MGQELLFLLLPLAALSGWLIGRRRKGQNDKASDDCFSLSQDYFKGLNYLLNEQSDKALEVFIQMSELDSETVELHFTLANLLVKRGEVDRAIRIHQNLIARPTLSPHDRNRALYELAQDYMRAGLLDRAEGLFSELVDDVSFGQQSRQQLLDVYQQEKEWDKAIVIARRLHDLKSGSQTVLAHFFCEQANEALQQGDSSLAMKRVRRAFNEDRNSVRASLIEAKIHLRNQNHRAAIKSLKKVTQQNSEYLPLILEPLQQAYEQQGNLDEYVAFLRQLPDEGSLSSALKLSEQLQHREGNENATQLLTPLLRRRPSLRILKRLLELRANKRSDDAELQLALITLDKFLADKPVFHCENCGFSSKTMQWQCPSCKQWDRVKPIHGIEGD
ncbi:MAG: lipopolysaccharide assembly protein LapB [Pseudomonadota bacterium]